MEQGARQGSQPPAFSVRVPVPWHQQAARKVLLRKQFFLVGAEKPQRGTFDFPTVFHSNSDMLPLLSLLFSLVASSAISFGICRDSHVPMGATLSPSSLLTSSNLTLTFSLLSLPRQVGLDGAPGNETAAPPGLVTPHSLVHGTSGLP